MNYLAFFAAIKHSNEEYLIETLREYSIGTYIVGKETTHSSHKETNGEHFHFLVQMTDEDYHKYAKRVFKDKFKLTGRATKGCPRQYGKVKQIENLERMKAYTVKSKNVISNMEQEELEHIIEESFEREDKLKLKDELFNSLDNVKLREWFTDGYGIGDAIDYNASADNYHQLSVSVIKYFIENDKPIPAPSVIKRYLIDYIQKGIKAPWSDRARLVYVIMDIRNPFRIN